MSDVTMAELHAIYAAFMAEHLHDQERTAWVMDLDSYRQIRAALGPPDDKPPDEWVPAEDDMLIGTPILVVDGGGEPHLEVVRQLRAHWVPADQDQP